MGDKPAGEPEMEAAPGGADKGVVEQADVYELTVTEESLMRLHDLTVTLPLPCDLCPIGTVFDNLEEFDAHMIEHPEAKMFACQLCSNTYRSWSNLVAHRKMFHFGEVLSCEVCGNRKSHERLEGSVHFPVNGKPHGCEECLIGLDTLTDVYRHYFSHKAPPGCSRRYGGNNFGPSQKKLPAELKSHSQNKSGSVNLNTSKTVNGGLVSHKSGNQKVFIGGAPIKCLSGSVVGSPDVGPSGTLPGNLIVCQDGNVAAAVPGNRLALNPSGIQNGNLIGNLLEIPNGTLMKHLPGIKIAKLVLKPIIIKGGVLKGKLIKSHSKEMYVKPAKISGGDVSENPISLQSSDSNTNQPGPSNVTLHGDLTSIGTGIASGNATATESPSSHVNSTKTQGEISSGDSHPMNQSKNQKLNLPVILSERLDVFVAEEPKKFPEKSGSGSKTFWKASERFIPIAPKGGFANLPALPEPRNSDSLFDTLVGSSPEKPVAPAAPPPPPPSVPAISEPAPPSVSKGTNRRSFIDSSDEDSSPVKDDLKDLQSNPVSEPAGHDIVAIENRHVCPHCTFSYAKLEEYRNHLVRNSGAHDCVMCSSNHLKRLSMTDHEYCQAKNQPFCCIPCATPLASDEEFNLHLIKFHTQSFLPCCLCGKKFNWVQYLDHLKLCQQRHIQWELRKQPKRITCEECNKTFHSTIAIRKHMKRHEANRNALISCETCGRVFQHKGAYSMHLRGYPTHGPPELRAKVQGSSTNYVCEKCGKTFAKQGGLKEHLLRHTGLKPYACPNCPKRLSTRSSLVLHVRRHTGERPYMCEICGKNFTNPTSLYCHQRKHRAGENVRLVRRPHSVVTKSASMNKNAKFTCPVCGKTLSSKLVFEGHIRQHTGERPFACKICGRGFTTSKIMKVHVKRHERESIVKKVDAVRWVHDVSDVVNKDMMDVEGGFDSNSSNNCIFVCPRCGVGLVSPDELEEHMAKGDCSSGGPEMFVLPMTSESECIDTGSMVVVGQHD